MFGDFDGNFNILDFADGNDSSKANILDDLDDAEANEETEKGEDTSKPQNTAQQAPQGAPKPPAGGQFVGNQIAGQTRGPPPPYPGPVQTSKDQPLLIQDLLEQEKLEQQKQGTGFFILPSVAVVASKL